jgi:hypothetical protein
MSDKKYDLNCKTLPTVLPAVDRIIAIGDVHGDFKLVIDSLEIAKVIKRSGNSYEWIGKDTVVVQVGDQNDSCRSLNGSCDHVRHDTADDIKIFKFYTYLHKLAKKEGGGVYSLIGNHEIMNVNGNFSYASNANIDSFKNYVDPYTGEKFNNAIEARKHAFSRGNEYANMLGCTRNSVLIIGDFLFIHAGMEAKFLQNYRGRGKLHELNALVRNWILNKLSHVSEEEEKVLNNSSYSPFWTRILGSLPPHLPYDDARCQEHLEPILNSYKIKGMIIGHTPQLDDGINSTCGNKLFRVDVAASKAFHDSDEGVTQKREPQILEIKRLSNNTYKYNVIFQKRDSYDVIVSDDNTSFGKLESRLPN